MCGIIGYIGDRAAAPIILEGLGALEYRGYDSAGIAVLDADGVPQLFKSAGKLSKLRSILSNGLPDGSSGRWAYSLGNPRWADRLQRAPALRLLRRHNGRAQRHIRELPRPEAGTRRRRAHIQLSDGRGMHPASHRVLHEQRLLAGRGGARRGQPASMAQMPSSFCRAKSLTR